MRRRHGRMAKLLSIPVLAVSGFVVAATLAGVGLAGVTTSSTTTTTTPPTTTTTTTPPTTTTTTTTTTTPRGEGCTPGFWKNHPDAWEGFSPDQTLGDVFDPAFLGDLADVTLLDALSFPGGSGLTGAQRILLRAAVAALLNSASVDFSMDTAEVIDAVNDALASEDRATILALATTLDNANNAGCPL